MPYSSKISTRDVARYTFSMSYSLFKYAETVLFLQKGKGIRPQRSMSESFSLYHAYRPVMQPGASGAGSVSRLELHIEIPGKGSINCEFVRHLAPTTCRALLNSLPMQGRVHNFGDQFVYFETGLIIGSEKQRSHFVRGDMGLLVSNASICIFLKDTQSQPMNPLGRVTKNIELAESTAPGDTMMLKKITA